MLHVAGDGPERTELEGLAPRWPRAGWCSTAASSADELAAAGAAQPRTAVVPSRWYENQPMAILEAFAASTPVVVTDMGGMPELVEPGVDGLVVPADDDARLAGALAHLDSSPEEAVTMGIAGRRRLEQDFAAAAHLSRLDVVYDKASTRAGRTAKSLVAQRSESSR